MAGNGGMRPTYGPFVNDTCLTVGGNTTIINGNEAEVIPTQELMTVRISELGEDDSHVTPAYREHNFGGS